MDKTILRVAVVGAVLVLATACARRNLDYDGRPDRRDYPRERVCCKFSDGSDYVTTRRRCFRRDGRPVHVRRCRID